LQVPLPAPAVDVWPVTIDKLVPPALVGRVLPQPGQQGYARRGEWFGQHRCSSFTGHVTSPILAPGSTQTRRRGSLLGARRVPSQARMQAAVVVSAQANPHAPGKRTDFWNAALDRVNDARNTL